MKSKNRALPDELLERVFQNFCRNALETGARQFRIRHGRYEGAMDWSAEESTVDKSGVATSGFYLIDGEWREQLRADESVLPELLNWLRRNARGEKIAIEVDGREYRWRFAIGAAEFDDEIVVDCANSD